MRLGLSELVVILIIVILVFGVNKIPLLGDALGKGIRNFKKASTEDDAIDVTPKSNAQSDPAASSAKAGGKKA